MNNINRIAKSLFCFIILTTLILISFCPIAKGAPITITEANADIVISVGQSCDFEAVVKFIDASKVSSSFKYGNWESSDNSIVKIDNKGTITGLKKGGSKITLSYIHGDIPFITTATVYVKQTITGLTLNKNNINIKVGESYTLKSSYVPKNTFFEEIEWVSDNKDIATVDKNGNIKGVNKGTTKITAITKYSRISVTCIVNVTNMVAGLKLNKTNLTLECEKTEELNAEISPSNAFEKGIIWSSSNSKIASVSNGKVKGISPGSAVIIAHTKDGGIEKACNVTVIPSSTNIQSISFKNKQIQIFAGEEKKIEYIITPKNAPSNNLIFSVSKPTNSSREILTISKDGIIKGISVGVSLITISTKDGKIKESIPVVVKKSATGIKISHKTLSLYMGEKKQISATVLPTTTLAKDVIWKSNNAHIAKVDSKGNITGVLNGTAIITAESVDGGYTDTCVVTVKNMVQSVNIVESVIRLGIDSEITPKVEILPQNAFIKKVTYSIKNPLIATVDSNGKIIGKNKGETELVIKSVDGEKTDTCKIIVDINAENLSLVDSNGKVISTTFKQTSSSTLSSNVKIIIDKKYVDSDISPFIESGRTLIPIRAISEKLGANVEWKAKEREVIVTKNNKKIELTISDYNAYIDNKLYKLDISPKIINDRTYVPIRFVSEALGIQIEWDASTKTVIINN